MDAVALLSFAGLAALLVASPGPNGVLIAKTVAASGRAAGFANIVGFVLAFWAHGAFSILGLSLLLVQSAEAFFVVKMLGAAYLIWVGLKALRAAIRGDAIAAAATGAPSKRRTLGVAFGEGFLTNLLNPKVTVFYLAVFPQFTANMDAPLLGAAAMVLIHSALNVVWFSGVTLAMARLARIGGGRLKRAFRAATGLIFVGFGVQLATYRP